MITARDFINRIKWDKSLNSEDYTIGFIDKGAIKKVPYGKIRLEDGNKFSFYIEDIEITEIPFHRIRKVWMKDKLVWERK